MAGVTLTDFEIEQDVNVLVHKLQLNISAEEWMKGATYNEKMSMLWQLDEEGDISAWFNDAVAGDTRAQDVYKDYLEVFYDKGKVGLKELLEKVVLEGEKQTDEIKKRAEDLLANSPQLPRNDTTRAIRTLQEIKPEELRAFPLKVLNELAEKLGAASQPIVTYEIPPDLRTMLTAMEPGEVSKDFVRDIQAQLG